MKNLFKYLIIWGLSLNIVACSSPQSNENTATDSPTKSNQESTASQTDVDQKTILFFGNSITAGYGLEPEQAFPAIIQYILDSLNHSYKVVNAGLSGETSAAGAKRIDWILKQKVDIFVLELGGNDGLRGLETKETSKNLQIIMDKVLEKYPSTKILFTGIEVPPNMGEDYASEFRAVFRDLADKNEVIFFPFILKDVGGDPELNQPDGIHPTAEGHQIIALNVWKYLKEML